MSALKVASVYEERGRNLRVKTEGSHSVLGKMHDNKALFSKNLAGLGRRQV